MEQETLSCFVCLSECNLQDKFPYFLSCCQVLCSSCYEDNKSLRCACGRPEFCSLKSLFEVLLLQILSERDPRIGNGLKLNIIKEKLIGFYPTELKLFENLFRETLRNTGIQGIRNFRQYIPHLSEVFDSVIGQIRTEEYLRTLSQENQEAFERVKYQISHLLNLIVLTTNPREKRFYNEDLLTLFYLLAEIIKAGSKEAREALIEDAKTFCMIQAPNDEVKRAEVIKIFSRCVEKVMASSIILSVFGFLLGDRIFTSQGIRLLGIKLGARVGGALLGAGVGFVVGGLIMGANYLVTHRRSRPSGIINYEKVKSQFALGVKRILEQMNNSTLLCSA